MLISYYANKKSSPRLPSWQPSLISFNTPINSGSIIKPCTLKHFQVPILAPGLTWVQYSINSHLFNSMSIGHPIPEIWRFQNLTLKIQGQGHGWGECWESQSGCNILSIHIPFVPCQSALPFMRYSIFKIWPWNSKVKVKWPWRCTTTGPDNSIELQMG